MLEKMIFKDLCNYYSDCLRNDNINIIFSLQRDMGHYFLAFKETGLQPSFSLADESYQEFLRFNYGKDCYVGYPCYISESNKVAPLFVIKTAISNHSSAVLNMGTFILNYGALKELNIFNEMPSQFVEKLGNLEEFPSDFEKCRKILLPFSSSVEWIDEGIQANHFKGKIVNQPILFRADALLASYSRGLKEELSKLSQMTNSQLSGTALSKILGLEKTNQTETENKILEVLQLNVEQEQALNKSFDNDISVITGPPGTGKSQIIASFVVNACLNGKSVLIASKNNKAVDVVEERINALGERPFVMRQGSGHYLQKLNEYFESLLQSVPTDNDFEEFEKFRSDYSSITAEINDRNDLIDTTIFLRNEVDKNEQEITELRNNKILYNYVVNNYDSSKLIRNSIEVSNILKKIDISSSCIKRLLYRMFQSFKQKRFTSYIETLKNVSMELGIDFSDELLMFNPLNIPYYKIIADKYKQAVDDCKRLDEYFKNLQKLSDVQNLPSIYSEISKLKEQRVKIAQKLWNKYILVHYGNCDQSKRQEILNVKAAISDAIALGKFSVSFEKIIPVKDFTPCWAVTSLSAFGRIPLQPGFYDYVVIDESSQCDIPSALPLLYRAKKAVIVGDPNQLKHISSIKPQVNEILMKKNKIEESRFSYLSCSLFDLASSVAKPFLIKNHYRCHPDIISFSNKYFYNEQLRVATNVNRLTALKEFSTGVYWEDIQGKAERPKSGSAFNKIEALKVVEILQAIVQSGFKGTIGVVSPFRAQINLIQWHVSRNELVNNTIEQNEIIVDTAHKFQGDEKDVIIFSPVIAPGISDTGIHFLNEQKNVFNVAITRAKSNLIIVGNLSYCSNCDVDFIKAFSSFVTSPVKKPTSGTLSNTSSDVISLLEMDFGKRMRQHNIKAISQYSACNYSLDFAVLDKNRKLDIEIDGEMYHKEWNGETVIQDIIRDNILEVNGWNIMRFWSYEIIDTPDKCISKILNWLDY